MNILIKILILLKIDLIIDKIISLRNHLHVKRISLMTNQNINFVSQGSGRIFITGNLKKFKIHPTSHLKSDTFIECSGGVSIGRCFHTGKGLTIFSANHNYDNGSHIPYDEKDILKPVIIEDFVWIGSNVTIVPGVTIGEGVVIGAGSLVTKSIPDYAVIGGNPAQILKYRDIEAFKKLKAEKKFY